MLTIGGPGVTSELLDTEAVILLCRHYGMQRDASFWNGFNGTSVGCSMAEFIKNGRDKSKEPDFAEGENEPDSISTPPTRAGC